MRVFRMLRLLMEEVAKSEGFCFCFGEKVEAGRQAGGTGKLKSEKRAPSESAMNGMYNHHTEGQQTALGQQKRNKQWAFVI